MKKTIILSIVMLVGLNMFAANRSRSEMLSIAASALSTDCATGRVLRAHSRVEPILESETPQYAIYSDEVGGFVIVSKRDDVRPVLGRSLGKYDANTMPDGLRWWLEETNSFLASGDNASEDADILKVDETVDNFVTAEWAQGEPYNLLCPKTDNSKRCLTGCSATATAMVLHYFKYPSAPTGTASYCVITQGTEDNDTTFYTNEPLEGAYAWDKMKDKYVSSIDPSKAVAKLMYDCGRALSMNYGYNGSAARSDRFPYALTYNFEYDSLSINNRIRSYCTNKEWYSIIRTELENRRPIIYGGVDDNYGGHAFVFSGINTDGQVYVNWGWSGDGNGWYSVDYLRAQNTQYNFKDNQSMTYGFVPQKSPQEGAENTSFWCYGKQPLELEYTSDKILRLKDLGLYNYNWRYFHGDLRLLVENEDDPNVQYSQLYNFSDTYFATWYGRIYYDFQDIRIIMNGNDDTNVPVGYYRVSFQTKAYDESQWQPVRKMNGLVYSYFSVAADGTVRVDNENSLTGIQSIISAPSQSAPSAIYSLDGRKVTSASSSKVVIMKRGDDVRKVIKQ